MFENYKLETHQFDYSQVEALKHQTYSKKESTWDLICSLLTARSDTLIGNLMNDKLRDCIDINRTFYLNQLKNNNETKKFKTEDDIFYYCSYEVSLYVNHYFGDILKEFEDCESGCKFTYPYRSTAPNFVKRQYCFKQCHGDLEHKVKPISRRLYGLD